MKNQIFYVVLLVFIFSSCENSMPGFRFSNFNNTPAEALAKAVKSNDIKKIRDEVVNKKVYIDFSDEKYRQTLLSLAIVNNKRKAFKELLKLGANPNLYDASCNSPLIIAIKINYDCDLFFIEELLKYNVDLEPKFFKKCNFAYDPLVKAIHHFNDEELVNFCIEPIKLIADEMMAIDLNKYNKPQGFNEGIIYNCLKTRNIPALKYFIVDLKCKVPERIFVNGTILLGYDGFITLEKVLRSKSFVFNHSEPREKAKKEILNFIENK